MCLSLDIHRSRICSFHSTVVRGKLHRTYCDKGVGIIRADIGQINGQIINETYSYLWCSNIA